MVMSPYSCGMACSKHGYYYRGIINGRCWCRRKTSVGNTTGSCSVGYTKCNGRCLRCKNRNYYIARANNGKCYCYPRRSVKRVTSYTCPVGRLCGNGKHHPMYGYPRIARVRGVCKCVYVNSAHTKVQTPAISIA